MTHAQRLDLKRSLQVALRWLVGMYILLLAATVIIACHTSRLDHERLANVMALSVRNSLIVRDLRQVIAVLNPSIGTSFTSIRFFSAGSSSIIELPSPSAAKEAEATLLTGFLDVPIASTGSESDSNAIGVLRFSYSFMRPVATSIALWLCFLVLAAPIFSKIRRFIEQRHREIVQAREADLLTSVARQVSHDIRSPLTALNMVVKQIEGIPEGQRKIIQNASERINGIANDLLNRSKPRNLARTGSPEFTRKKVPLADLLRSVFTEKQVALSSRHEIELALDLNGPIDAACDLDEKEFSRVLSNLINNAVEAIEGTGKVTIALRSSLKDVAVLISDTGRGIPEDILKLLGNEPVSHGKYGMASGSGLGFYHAKSVIEAIRGKISIQSRLGIGTIITITLPRVEIPEAPTHDDAEE